MLCMCWRTAVSVGGSDKCWVVCWAARKLLAIRSVWALGEVLCGRTLAERGLASRGQVPRSLLHVC